MSISHSQRVRLGIFMTAGAVLLVIVIAVPLGLKLRKRVAYYTAYFEGESLSGLEEGANVKYHGVGIGTVSDISFDAGNLNMVKVELEIRDDFPMKTDMYAQAGFIGITGLLYVEIMGGSDPSAELLPEGGRLRTTPSVVATITGKAEVITAKVELLLNYLTRITHPDTLRAAREIMENVAVLTRESRLLLSDAGPELRDMSRSASAVVSRFEGISADVKEITGTIAEGFGEGKLPAIIERLDSSAVALTEASTAMSLTLRQAREDIVVSLENFRETTENLNQLSKLLLENPSLLIRGDAQRERTIR